MNNTRNKNNSVQQTKDNQRLSSFDRLVIENQNRISHPELLSDKIRQEIEDLRNQQDEILPFKISRIPKRLLFFCIILDIIGFTMAVNSVQRYINGDTTHFCLYILFATLMLVPGLYFAWKCFMIGFIRDRYERECIIASLPTLN